MNFSAMDQFKTLWEEGRKGGLPIIFNVFDNFNGMGGQTMVACADGPDFDGFEVDFDEAMHRGTMYKPFEAHAREAECNLLKQEVQ